MVSSCFVRNKPFWLFLLLSFGLPILSWAAHVRGTHNQQTIRRTQGGGMNMNNGGQAAAEDPMEDLTVEYTPPENTPPENTPIGGAGVVPGSLPSAYTPGGSGAATTEEQACPNQVYTDVVIVGAGMAGISAAATLQQADPLLDYVILESTDRVGGRVKSVTIGDPSNPQVVEEGANWIFGDKKNNPVVTMMQETDFQTILNDFTDASTVVYDGATGLPVDLLLYAQELERFLQAKEQVATDVNNQWGSNHEFFQDEGIKALFAQHNWLVTDDSSSNLDYTLQWDDIDYEYTMADTSVRFHPIEPYEPLFTIDPRGFEHLPQHFFQNNVNPANLKTSTRVFGISYNEYNIPNLDNGKTYKAKVKTMSAVDCTDYFAQRVILTVSPGVLDNELIQFSPPLRYSPQLYNPMQLGQFVKVFYQFPNQFWDTDAEFIRIIPKDVASRGKCHQWQNMAHPDFMPGSNLIRCDIMTESFEELRNGGRTLTPEMLDALLEPLRTVYGAEVVGTPIDTHVTTLHLDANFGFGAYANWKVGYTFTQYAHFYGGIDDLVPYCQHNGCNLLQEWIVHISGSASCYNDAESVHGAFYAGERSANYVLKELGYNANTDKSPCDVNWSFLQ